MKLLKTLAVLALTLVTSSVMAHSYPKLSNVSNASAYTDAVGSNKMYNISSSSKGLLRDYYSDMRFKSEWESKDRILNDRMFYTSVGQFSGEVCALIWRYENNKPAKSRYDVNGNRDKLNNKEKTPFFDSQSPWLKENFAVTYTGRQNAYKHFAAAGETYGMNHIGYPIHRLGAVFGSGGQGRSNDLIISMQTYFLDVDDGDINTDNGTLLKGDSALLTMIMLPGTINEIGNQKSEANAYNWCRKNSKFIIPHN
jgi:hypothetical protein